VVCGNGLGHVRRVISVATFMLKTGFSGDIDAYLPESHIKLLGEWPDCRFFVKQRQVTIINFVYPIRHSSPVSLNHPRRSSNLYSHDWMNIELPNLKKYDVVWSDNILQVLEQRDDAILTGSFFWHEVLRTHIKKRKQLQGFVEAQTNLLSTRPTMAANEYFSTHDVRNLTDFVPVGLYRYSLLYREKTNRGILLSCGLGGEEEAMAKEAVAKIIDEKLVPPDLLFVEPRLLPSYFPAWIKNADFSSEMYHYCSAVVIRPGIGTISDSLISHNRIFMFLEDDSFEMTHNSKVLEKLSLGERCQDPYHAYRCAIAYVNNRDKMNAQILKTSHLRTDGVFATADLITSRF